MGATYVRLVRDRRGTITIEYLLGIVLLVLLLFGALEFARAAAIKHALGVGSWQAARYLSLHPWDDVTAEALARQSIQDSVFGGNPGPAVVSFAFSDPARRFGTAVSVRIEMMYQAMIPFMNLTPRTLTGESAVLVEAWP
ncbi:MAG: hypothetical protein JW934_21220 [Anaerolineae bacterium]|nr:hypothetical protein [Anaerolineae bacterium]